MKVSIHSGAVSLRKKARIEMLPLIDIVFLLLVFFIYAMLSMAVHRGMTVSLPESSTAEVDQERIISVTVKSDGTIYLDKELISLEEFGNALSKKIPSEETGEGKEPGVLLFADSSLSYQQLFNVLDTIRKAGLNKISLQSDPISVQEKR